MLLFKYKKILKLFIVAGCLLTAFSTYGYRLSPELENLKSAYPDYIKSVTNEHIYLKDGTVIPLIMLNNTGYNFSLDDIGRIRYEAMFRKMYGYTKQDVEKKLTVIYWMPHVFGYRYPLQVTTANGVDKKLAAVSAELEKLPRSYYKYLKDPQGTYCWRYIANTHRLSTHSFGTTIDINRKYSDYWQWDLQKAGRQIRESASLGYHNRIPSKIVSVFEKHGFIWGGDWYHYDTMHFEYRPEVAMA